MTLFPPQQTSPLDDVWVAIDLETTGLESESDEIIEVGAVKFRGSEVLDTFQSLVNPRRQLPPFIRSFTGITQAEVDGAPLFQQVARDLAVFVGNNPLLGHNVQFDLGFLNQKGLRFSNTRCDTWDMAYMLLPGQREYSLGKLAAYFGLDTGRAHRAVADADAARQLFLKLADIACGLDPFTLAEMERLAAKSNWVLSHFIRRMARTTPSPFGRSAEGLSLRERKEGTGGADKQEPPSYIGVTGYDIRDIKDRIKHLKALKANSEMKPIDIEQVEWALSSRGPMAQEMPAFEERQEQIVMARAVAKAINDSERLIVEAGTGTGKSLAYLLPAAMYAVANNKRVVISTNTINLQEQLLNKDIPTLVKALSGVDGFSESEFHYTLLKGRSNYLCLKKWAHMRGADSLADDEARMMAKVLMWLRTTQTGDRNELNLGHRNASMPWERLSAQGARDCNGMNGVCFLRAARERAAGAHITVVNHALLMTDLIAGSALIPEYDILIVDEAQHLEEEATKHLGFEVGQQAIDDHLQTLGGDKGLINQAVTAFRGSKAAETRRKSVEEAASNIGALLPGIRESQAAMFSAMHSVIGEATGGESGQDLRVTPSTRGKPEWMRLSTMWENADVYLSQLDKELQSLGKTLEGLDQAKLVDYEALTFEVANAVQRTAEIRLHLAEYFSKPEDDGIYWVTVNRRNSNITLYAAPLHVGEQLETLLYSQKESVIFTSATLSTNRTFDHIRERTGFLDSKDVLLGSPFDYPLAALLCVPQDIPEPSEWAYQSVVERAVTDAATAASGRTMALFTSHAALQSTAAALRGPMQTMGVDVLAQGADGTPHQLIQKFIDNPKSVILGTASFWEGVDIPDNLLKVLIVAKLPFSVPTEPVFSARSELYENPFMEYAMPQAILRIRQGFGRLIRRKTDRGVAIILDKRVISKKYGRDFIRSLPPATLRACKASDLGREIRAWIG